MRRPLLSILASIAVPGLLAAQAACPRARLPAYAHNDYLNVRPLTDALALGYRGVEADVFLVDGVLQVAHDRRRARTSATFERTYIAPLDAWLSRCDTLTGDTTRFLLAVELKEPERAGYDTLVALLQRYPSVMRGVDVVLVGWSPEAATLDSAPLALRRQYRIRRPERLPASAQRHDVGLLSVDYGKTMGRWWARAATRRRWLDALAAIDSAYPASRVRVHNVPVSAAVYRALRSAGVDLIGTKDLSASARVLESISTGRP